MLEVGFWGWGVGMLDLGLLVNAMVHCFPRDEKSAAKKRDWKSFTHSEHF